MLSNSNRLYFKILITDAETQKNNNIKDNTESMKTIKILNLESLNELYSKQVNRQLSTELFGVYW